MSDSKPVLEFIAAQDAIRIFNACGGARSADTLYERLLNRINRTMQAWDSHALLIMDEGKEWEYTRLRRRMGVFNPIPSQYGHWADTSFKDTVAMGKLKIAPPAISSMSKSPLLMSEPDLGRITAYRSN